MELCHDHQQASRPISWTRWNRSQKSSVHSWPAICYAIGINKGSNNLCTSWSKQHWWYCSKYRISWTAPMISLIASISLLIHLWPFWNITHHTIQVIDDYLSISICSLSILALCYSYAFNYASKYASNYAFTITRLYALYILYLCHVYNYIYALWPNYATNMRY